MSSVRLAIRLSLEDTRTRQILKEEASPLSLSINDDRIVYSFKMIHYDREGFTRRGLMQTRAVDRSIGTFIRYAGPPSGFFFFFDSHANVWARR